MCGEKLTSSDTVVSSLGSPPRVRGKGHRPIRFQRRSGSTPACAGKRLRSFPQQPYPWDHPRVCGEKFIIICLALTSKGSPPRVRGKDRNRIASDDRVRITPACAGKRVSSFTIETETEDHPRVCGEKTKKVLENSELLIPCVSDFIEFLINPECGTTVLQGSVKPLRLYVKIVRQRL